MSCFVNKESLIDCQNKPIPGVKKYVIEYFYRDWRAMVDAGLVVRDADGTITSITNAVGVQAYKKEVPDFGSIVPSVVTNRNPGAFPNFTHGLNYPVVGTGQEYKNSVENASVAARVCIIFKNSGEGEIYGDEQGMVLTNTPYNPNEPNIGNTVPVELATDENGAKESHLPVSVFNVDAATTEAMIEGLTTPGV